MQAIAGKPRHDNNIPALKIQRRRRHGMIQTSDQKDARRSQRKRNDRRSSIFFRIIDMTMQNGFERIVIDYGSFRGKVGVSTTHMGNVLGDGSQVGRKWTFSIFMIAALGPVIMVAQSSPSQLFKQLLLRRIREQSAQMAMERSQIGGMIRHNKVNQTFFCEENLCE